MTASLVCRQNFLEGTDALLDSLDQPTDKICVRVSVDLPTGVTDKGTEDSIRADFTYCTGIVKEPILKSENAEFVGRIRYLDLGFFREDNREEINRRVLKPNLLKKTSSVTSGRRR